MAVNTMNINQAYELVRLIHQQATGEEVATPTNTYEFVSVAQKTLQAGYDPVLNAISQVIGRTIFSNRPYTRKFKGIEMTNERWGGIRRKISLSDTQAMNDPTYELVDGEAIDQYKVRKPKVLETRFVGSNVYEDYYTVFTKQLDVAFSNESEFASFMALLTQNASDKFEQWEEGLARMTLCNAIASKSIVDTDSTINLLTEYNEATGLSLDAQTVMQQENFSNFIKWAHSRIADLTQKMTERSQLFQMNIEGNEINRHTPYEDQRVYLLANFKAQIDAMVKSSTYNADYLTLSDVESVGYWQSIKEPMKISVAPSYMNANGEVVNGENTVVDNVIGVIFDRDAIGMNIYDDSIDTSPYNAHGQYWNVFHHARTQYTVDLTEKIIVLKLA